MGLLSDSPSATAAAKGRRWLLLSNRGRRRPADSSLAADANTVAESRTSNGRRVCVSLRCAAPPSSSYLYYDFPESARVTERQDQNDDEIRIVAAHGEWVLFKTHNPRSCSVDVKELFLCRTAGAGRPPSLSLLPVLDVPPTMSERVPASYFDSPFRPRLESRGIGLLRRGQNDHRLVYIDLWHDRDAQQQMAVFCVLRQGMHRWELMEPVPTPQYAPSPDHVICVGDRFLCSVSYGGGFLLCDMADEASPKVRYAPLPLEVMRCSYGYDDNRLRVQHMGVTGDSSVRLVSVHPYCCRSDEPYYCSRDDHDPCCCDGYDTTECWHPRFVFTIKTWRMNLSMEEPLEWVEDGQMNGEEIWALPGYEGLPQAIPEWPVVCLDNPNAVCFLVSNFHFTRDDEKAWMVQLNMKTKTILSVVQITNYDRWENNYHLPSEIQY